MRHKPLLIALAAGIAALGTWAGLRASDHDDGETDLKSRSLNLTDLYVFREGDQTGAGADNQNLVFVMNTNPRSVARQQYYFSTNARYEFHVTRRASRTDAVTGQDDVTLRFQFGAPDALNRQAITLTAIRDGQSLTADAGLTTPLATASVPLANDVPIGGSALTVFAGLREDPFFFDVEAFFRVRAALRGEGPAAGFRDLDNAVDFAKGYNVNAIVVRVPIAFLAGSSGATTFDVWETVSIPQ